MILVTVFKDRERYESDLRKSYNRVKSRCGSDGEAWMLAKEETSKVDFTQKVHLSSSFFTEKKPHEIKEAVYAIGHDIAKNRRFKAKLSVGV